MDEVKKNRIAGYKSYLSELIIFKNRFFLVGLAFKLILSFLFAGDFLRTKFIPFVQYFINSGFNNPYAFYLETGVSDAFPYPPLMLYILSFPGGYLSDMSPLFFRIPLLIADIFILILLCKLLKGRENKVLLYYWFSPVLIYITYIHGQLDAIPIMFLIASFYFMFKRKYLFSAIIFGLGLATKTNLVLALPFCMFYVLKTNDQKQILKSLTFLGVVVTTFMSLNIPYLSSNEFLEMVYNNNEQNKIWGVSYSLLSNYYYIIPAIYIVLLAKFIRFRLVSKDLFLLFVGFSFSMLLIFIPPKVGWYFWIIPFFIYFNIKEQNLSFFPLFLLQGAFILYFLVIPESDIGTSFLFQKEGWVLFDILSSYNIDANFVVNFVFTVLQTVLILNVYWIYRSGIKKNSNRKIKNLPFIIGIGGDSGVGKSTLTKLLQDVFGIYNISIIRGDDMHRWERGDDNWKEFTHLSPKANHLHEEIKYLKRLKIGGKIFRRHYDHDTGKFTDPIKVYPKKIVVFEGLHPFYISAKRDLFDLKVFVAPDENLRYHWKINRDVSKRGYTKERIIEQLEFREEDSEKYIRSQAKFSDIIIKYFPLDNLQDIGNNDKIETGIRLSFETNIDVHDLVNFLSDQKGFYIKHEYDIDNQILDVKGKISKDTLEVIMYKLVDDYDEYLDNHFFQDDLKGFLQLFFIHYIINKSQNY